jgi:hypothetical protein
MPLSKWVKSRKVHLTKKKAMNNYKNMKEGDKWKLGYLNGYTLFSIIIKRWI